MPPQTGDSDLLRAYLAGSQDAFTALVARYLPLVEASARRQVADPATAEDVTQAVFILLAQKARSLRSQRVVAGWLLRATQYCAANARKQAQRRTHHEQKAAAMKRESTTADLHIFDLAPSLDAALGALSTSDRDALVLHLLQQQTLDEVAVATGISKNAAHKRITRALERVRRYLARRGTVLSAGALGASLAVPPLSNVHAAMTSAAVARIALGVAGGQLAGGNALMLAKRAWTVMNMLKLKLAAACIAAMLMLGGGVLVAEKALSQPPVVAEPFDAAKFDAEAPNLALEQTWRDYMTAVTAQAGNPLPRGWYSNWEARFVDALAMPGGNHVLRLRLMGELAAMQPDPDKRSATLEQIVTLGQRWDMPDERTRALEDLWSHSRMRPLDEQLAAARRLEDAYEQVRNLPPGRVLLSGGRNVDGMLADLHCEVAGRYRIAAQNQNLTDARRKALLEQAADWIARSLDAPADGINPRVNRLFTLGQLQLDLKRGKEASETFQKVLADESKPFARMWVAQLELQARHPRASQAYRDGLEQILRDYPPDAYFLPLQQDLGMRYVNAGLPKKAIPVLEAIVGKDSDAAVNAYNAWLLSTAYRGSGQPQRARELLDEILRKWPDTGSAQLARDSISSNPPR